MKAHIHDPNAPELVHFLFTPLSLIYEASRDPIHQGEDLSERAVSPLMVHEAKQLLINCLTSKELELWQRLGKSWTLTKYVILLIITCLALCIFQQDRIVRNTFQLPLHVIICTLKCLSIGTPKTINFPFVSNEKLMIFMCSNIQSHYNKAVIYLNFGTPKNDEFSIWNKWKIYYF